MKILVTGAHGFLGTALAREISRRCPRAKLFRLTRTRKSPGEIECDLSDAQETASVIRRIKPDWIFHAAGLSRHGEWRELWRAHVESTIKLLDAVAASDRAGRTRVVIAGSSGEYGAGPGNSRNYRVDERVLARPVTQYGASKLCESLCALSYGRRGIPVMVARIFNVIGPGIPEHLALGTFAQQIAEIESGSSTPREKEYSLPAAPRAYSRAAPEIFVGNLKPRRDYVDVRDVAAGLVAIARRGVSGEIYNLGSGKADSMDHLLRRMLAQSRVKVRIVVDRARFRKVEAQGIVGDCRKLRALGWAPKISLTRSLSDTLDWYRERSRA